MVLDILYYSVVYAIAGRPDYTNVQDSTTPLQIAILGPIVEEVIFRVVGLKVFEKVGGRTFSVIITSVSFGLMHPSTKVLPAIMTGVALALLVYLTGSVWYAFLYHLAMNGIGFVLDFLFPGTSPTHLVLVVVIVLIVSFILLFKRPIFSQLLKWCNPKRVIESIKSHKSDYKQLASSPVFLVVIITLALFAFFASVGQLTNNL